jgi:hypothetical protein
MASLLGVFLLAYVIPYYISVNKKDIVVANQFKASIGAENKENVGESASKAVSQTLDEMKAVELFYNNKDIIPSVYFNKIIANKNTNIQITELSFAVLTGGQGQFFISGISKNREGLIAFIEDLKFKAGFVSVESPISDFAKDSDIPFTLNIKN